MTETKTLTEQVRQRVSALFAHDPVLIDVVMQEITTILAAHEQREAEQAQALAAFTEYLRQDETPIECLLRHRSEADALLTLMAQDRFKLAEQAQEIERLRGITPECPPRPPITPVGPLPRYGLRWNGPESPLATPMDDGYWTPWHCANAELREKKQEIERLRERLDLEQLNGEMVMEIRQVCRELVPNSPTQAFADDDVATAIKMVQAELFSLRAKVEEFRQWQQSERERGSHLELARALNEFSRLFPEPEKPR